jgi:hypothetical protein
VNAGSSVGAGRHAAGPGGAPDRGGGRLEPGSWFSGRRRQVNGSFGGGRQS